MDNHPIPQDITGFQFKLIGDMTIKQFAYLATGSVLAWIIFSLPVSFFIKLPFTTIFLVFGVSFAFFSIEGRPVDTMIINFIKAAFSPTQFVYQKMALQNATISTPVSEAASASAEASAPKNKLDQREFDFFKMLSQLLPSSSGHTVDAPDVAAHSLPHIISAQVTDEEKKKTIQQTQDGEEQKKEEPTPQLEVLVEQSQILQQELEKAKEEEKKDEGSKLYETAHEKVLELETLLNNTVSEKQSLEKELMELRKQLGEKKEEIYKPSVAQAIPQETKNVRMVSNELGKSVGLPIAPEFPNVISGIIKDPRGNPLPNILVEVKDKEGNPVRAFKTTPLGQFSASTPLANGDYTVEFEDPNAKNKFDTVGFSVDGNIILPIEVISIDPREELRKTLFS